MKQRIGPQKWKGTFRVPASKSDGQRALLSAALANGRSELINVGKSDDELAMKNAIQVLGAKVTENGDTTIVEGPVHPTKSLTISAGESGLGIRLLTAVCAVFDQEITIEGKGSLVTRPMDFFEDVLPKLGASVRTNNGKVPVTVKGPMAGGNITVDGSLSSQFVSGCLMALPFAAQDAVLTAENLTSVPYVNMTLATLKAFGIQIERFSGNTFGIPGNQKYCAAKYTVEADWSSAGYFLVAAALGHEIEVKGLSMSSLQADKMLLDALLAAGCKIIHSGDTILVDGPSRRNFEFDATQCPDLFPALVVLAAGSNGKTKLFGANRLKHKESDRAFALKQEFGKLGVQIDVDDDEMIIHGTGKILGGKVESHHDHRIAMCLAVAGTIAEDIVEIENAEAVSKSFPSFWDEIVKLR